MEWIDPYGATEHFIDAVAREIVCPGLVRMMFGSVDHGQVITRVKILVAEDVFDRERAITDAYLATYRRRAMVM